MPPPAGTSERSGTTEYNTINLLTQKPRTSAGINLGLYHLRSILPVVAILNTTTDSKREAIHPFLVRT